MKRLATIVLAAAIGMTCATTKQDTSTKPQKPESQHQPIQYAKHQAEDLKLYLLNTSGEANQTTWMGFAKPTGSDVMYIQAPELKQYTSAIKANNLEEALQPQEELQTKINQAVRTTNTILFEEHRIIDAPTYVHKEENLIFYFFDKNQDGKIHNFLDAMQLVKLNEEEDNQSIYRPHIHRVGNENDTRLPPRRYFHLTHDNYAPAPSDENQRYVEQPRTQHQ